MTAVEEGRRIRGPEEAGLPAGESYMPGEYRKEALDFLREHIGQRQYERIMGRADSRQHPYVAARLFLSPLDWARYVWIEHHGTMEGFL